MRLLQSAMELEPRHARAYVQLAKVHLAQARPEGAVPLLRRAIDLAPDTASALGPLAFRDSMSGQRNECGAIARQLDGRSAGGRTSSLAGAGVAMALGRLDEALDWLEKAAEAHEPMVIYLAVDPHYESLGTQPRFSALLRRLGLPAARF